LPKNGEFISLHAPAIATSVYKGDTLHCGANLATDGGMQTRWASADTTAVLTLDLESNKPFNKIDIFEYCDVKNGNNGFENTRINRIQLYRIEILNDNRWETIYVSDEPMNDCKVIRFPRHYQTSKLRLNILKASAPPSIYELNVINEK